MNFIELQTAIILIESKYTPEQRNTPKLMKSLLKTEFDEDVSEEEIINFYGLGEDWEKLNRQLEYEDRY